MADTNRSPIFNEDSSPDNETKKKVYISKKLRRKATKKVEVQIAAAMKNSILNAFSSNKGSTMNVTVIADSPKRDTVIGDKSAASTG